MSQQQISRYPTNGDSNLLRNTETGRSIARQLSDLLLITLERSTSRPSKHYCLTNWQYVSGEEEDGKFSMLLSVQAKDLDLGGVATLTVQLSAGRTE